MLRRCLALALVASCNCFAPPMITREFAPRSRAPGRGMPLRLFARHDDSSSKAGRRDVLGWMTVGVASALLQGYQPTPAEAVISDFAKLRELEELQVVMRRSIPSQSDHAHALFLSRRKSLSSRFHLFASSVRNTRPWRSSSIWTATLSQRGLALVSFGTIKVTSSPTST